MKAWYRCRMNGDDKAGTKLEQEREKEPGRCFTTFTTNGNCSVLQCSETKKKETKGVRDLFSQYIQGLIKGFLLAIKNRLDKTSNGSQNWMANKKHSGRLLTDSGLGTWASYKTAWIIGRIKKNFNWRDDEKYYYFGYAKFSCKCLKKKLKMLMYTKHERPSTK